MPELRDLESHPVAGRQRGDQASDYASLADVSRVTTNDDDCHAAFFNLSASSEALPLLIAAIATAGAKAPGSNEPLTARLKAVPSRTVRDK